MYRRVTHAGAQTEDPPTVRDFFYLTDSQFSARGLIGSDGRARPYETLRYDAYRVPTHRYPEDLDDSGSVNFIDQQRFLQY